LWRLDADKGVSGDALRTCLSDFRGVLDGIETLDTAVADAILDRNGLLLHAVAVRDDDRLALFQCEPLIERSRRRWRRIVGGRISARTWLP
jgi:hypothetical protein